jgi:hypothetical protein
VGPSNSGKSTIVNPFDTLFGFSAVHHKPAEGSSFALRNIARKHKRFLYWDDYRPVEYAQSDGKKTATVPVAAFLSLFQGEALEINASQSFHDGNMDVAWKKGCVITAKVKDLWKPTGNISEEDIEHMRNRCEMFVATAKVAKTHSVPKCEVCMARWIRDGSAEFDQCVPCNTPMSTVAACSGESVAGMDDLCTKAMLPSRTAEALRDDLINHLGATNVQELTVSDWQTLASWTLVKPLERRRLLAVLGLA